MADSIQAKGLSFKIEGKTYDIDIPTTIYDELGLGKERFAELLSRDLYCPTMNGAPTEATLTYADTDGSTNHFQIGQSCRWLDNGLYRIAIATNVTSTSITWYVLPVNVSELTNDAGFLTEHQDISGKQDKSLKFTNLSAATWQSDATYADYPYRCDISCTGVTADMYAEVVFDIEQATSGEYAPLCETKAGVVSIWSSSNTAITIPTIIITQ